MPIKRLGQASDIAKAALLLCCPAALDQGQIMTISGGDVQELD